MLMTESAKLITACLCVAMTIVLREENCLISDRTNASEEESRPAVGSSNKISGESFNNARIKPSRWSCPRLNFCTAWRFKFRFSAVNNSCRFEVSS